MTESPNSPPTNEPNPRKRFGRVKIAIGILLLTGVGGGIAWGWWFVDRELVPLVTRELSKTLKRPVKIGEIESISLGSIQAGKSAIPATTTDPDSVEMEGVRVRFNLLKFLWSRKLDLDVLLLEPTAYLERDADGAWVSTEIAEGEGEGAIQVILNRIALEKGTVTLSDPEIDIAWAEREAQEQAEEDAEETEADTTENTETEDTEDTEETELELPVLPPPPSETTFKRVDSSVEFLDEGDRLKFEATGYPTTGRTRVRGEYLASKSALKLNVSGQNLPAGEASILVDLPVTIATGKINTNLNVELQTGGSSVPPNLEGNLRFEEIDAQIDNVPQPIVQGDGQLRFAGSLIQIEETQANYGLLPVAIPQGLMDLTQGYEIPIQVLPTDLAQYLATLQLESPVEISGEAEAILQIVGPIDTPVLIGETQTTDITTIDRIPFGDLSAQFALSTADGQIAIENIQATSDVGGSIQGKVLVQLPTQDNPDPSQGLPAAPENTPQENTPQIEENGASPLPQLDDATPPPTENSEVEENPDSPAPQLENPTPNEPAAEEKSDRPVQKFEVDENSPLAPFATDGEIPNSENLEPDADLDLETVEPRDLELEDIEPGNPEPNIREPETASENPTPASPETDAETEPQPLIEGEFLALDMPGEAIAQLYDANLPPGIAIGTVDARAIVLGPADDLQTLVQWEALSGTYPAKGEIEILPAGLRFQNTLVQVADSIVQAGGILVGDRWQAEFLLDQTPLNALLTPEQTQGFDLGTATGPIQIAGTLDAFDLASIEGLGQLDLTVGGGTVRAVGRLAQGQWAADVGLTDTAIASFLPPETTQGLNLGPATGQLEFAGSIDSFDLASIEGLGQLDLTVGGGTVRAVGRLAQGQWAADLGLTDTAIASFLPPETTQRLNLGPATGQLSLAGSIDSFDLAGIEGGGQLDLTVDGSNVRAVGGLSRGRWETTFELANTPITPFLPPNATQGLNLGPATGQISLGGTLDSFDLANIQGGGQLNLTVAGGDAIVAGELDAGRWNAEIAGSQIPLASFTPEPNDDLGLVGGNVVLSGGDLSFDLNAIVGSGIVGWNLGAGGAQAAVTLAEGRWSADVQQFELPLVPFLPLLPPEVAASGLFGSPKTSAVVGGKGNVGGTIDSLLTANWQNFDANAQVAVGLVGGGAQGDVALKNGRWEANLETLQVPLAPFLPLLPQEVATYISPKLSIGPLVNVPGEPLRLAGSLAGLTPENLFADGAIGFELNGGQSEFLLDGEFDRGIWNARTNVRQLDLNTFFPTEVVSALSGGVATAQIQGQLDGGLSLSGTLRDFTPEAIAAALQPEAIVEGVFELRQFAVNETTFDAEINGQITRTKEGLVLQAAGQEGSIAGERDYLTALFGDTFIPNALETQFDLTANTLIDSADDPNRPGARGLLWEEQTQTVFASAVREGDILNTQVENIPLSLFGLSLPESLASAPIAGRISGDAAIDLATQTGRGNIQIDRPSIGMTRADLLAGTFNYTGKSLTLADTVLNKGVSEYRLAGRVDLNPKDPQFAGSVEIESGQIQDVLATLGWFEVLDVARGLNPPDYTPASELDLPTVGIPDAPLLDQLRRFSEIVELLEQQRAERKVADPLPGLYELEGLFNGRVDVTGSVNTGADLAFALDGGDWGWGKLENREGEEYSDRYRVNQLEVVGSLQDGLWDFSRLDVRGNLGQAAETQLEFAGQIGGKQQSAQFDLVNLPLEFIEQFTEFPLGIQLSGNLNTSTTLAGSFDNPQARGELSIGDGVFNGEALEFGRGSFSFNQARLNFSSQLAVESPDEPIRLRGSIPYEFPGSTVKPETEAFDLEVNVQNEGLSVLNLFNDQAIWESGQGTVKLNIEGERIDGVGYLPQSTIGLIDLENAVFSSPTLPEPLTNVTGTLQLQDNRVIVEELTGQFEKGQVTASGIYPLAFPLLAEDEPPLTVDLQGVELDLKGLYRGGIDGQVIIGGYFLVPEIGGKITLSDGRVMLAEQTATTAEPEIDFSDPLAPVVLYDNLKLRLAPKTQILTPPVLNFLADGELTITGTIEDPRAAGTIFLRQGLVNLFTTQFTLARNYKNTATFLPERGLDPILAVLMRASVQEATRERFSTDPTGTESLAEIEESAIERGTVQTVRIEAKVTGPASELANNLELTSRPARTQSEIVALMGGGFVNTLGRGDTTLAIANLASSVLLTQIQSAVGQTLGLQDFRLFPATNSQTSTLTLGAEIGIDLTEDISTSILRILDSRESTRFNLRYRLSDSVQLRGSTDFDEDHRGEIELQFRF